MLSQAMFISHVGKKDIGIALQLMSRCGTVEGYVHCSSKVIVLPEQGRQKRQKGGSVSA
jgi:hypothetical protein